MRILLVEDNERLAESLKKLLEVESYAVDWRTTAEDAYDLLSFESYAAIILDIALPGMDGIALAKKIRQEQLVTPILMLTAKGDIKDRIVGFDSGADDYIVKPFDFNELLAHLRALIRRGTNNLALTYTVDTLTLDPASHIVKRRDKEIALSAREYAFLEFLMRHAGEIMTKQQVIENVWDSDLDPFSNNVDVYLGYLRKKIDKEFPQEKPLVQTIKGLGYRIRP
jgi:two-component system, OmpR family, response regulator